MTACPYCGEDAPTLAAEVAHMNAKHPEIVAQRLRDAGFVWDEKRGWVDTLVDAQ
jgi:hypothetical protein